jgi:hypothetical protein
MFFPCTQSDTNESVFATKPTIIMCAPNAHYYQQMVTAANAYWLNFFLKRDINVVCWNYRGYGESEASLFEYLSPSMAKTDAEHVLVKAVQFFNLKG